MKLLTVTSSPFGRKILIALGETGLREQTEIQSVNFLNLDDPIHAANPLGKMPALVDGDTVISDSPLIIEALDQKAGPGSLIPTEWPERLRQLQIEAWADGMMDAGAMLVLEKKMRTEEQRSPRVIEFQRRKIVAGLDRLSAAPPAPTDVRVASIAMACMLGFLDRRGQVDWRPRYPGLVAWLDAFRGATPHYDATHVDPEEGWVSL